MWTLLRALHEYQPGQGGRDRVKCCANFLRKACKFAFRLSLRGYLLSEDIFFPLSFGGHDVNSIGIMLTGQTLARISIRKRTPMVSQQVASKIAMNLVLAALVIAALWIVIELAS